MATVYSRLTIRNFMQGWPFYWRMNAPYWVHVLFALLVLSAAFRMDEVFFKVAPRLLLLPGQPFLGNIISGAVFYGAGWPLLKRLQSGAAQKCDTEFLRAQFAMFKSLDKINRALFGFLAGLLFLIYNEPDLFAGGAAAVRWGFWIFVGLLVAVVMILVAFFGWLGDQLNVTFRGA